MIFYSNLYTKYISQYFLADVYSHHTKEKQSKRIKTNFSHPKPKRLASKNSHVAAIYRRART